MPGQKAIIKSDAAIMKVGSVLSIISGAILLCLAIFITVEVTLRFTLNKPISGVVEIGQIMMAYIVFMAMAYTLGIKRHIVMDLFTMRMSRQGKLICAVIAHLFGLVLVAIFTAGSARYFWYSWSIKETEGTMLLIYTFIGKFAMLAGLALMSIQFLTRLLVNLVELFRK